MNEYPKEIALYFVGSGPHTWPILDAETEKKWRYQMAEIAACFKEGKGLAALHGDNLWLHTTIGNFIGWEIRQPKQSYQDQLTSFLNVTKQGMMEQSQLQKRVLKEMDPDADAPWRQQDE